MRMEIRDNYYYLINTSKILLHTFYFFSCIWKAWCAFSIEPWAIVKLKRYTYIKAVVIKCPPFAYVTKFRLYFGLNGKDWTQYSTTGKQSDVILNMISKCRVFP